MDIQNYQTKRESIKEQILRGKLFYSIKQLVEEADTQGKLDLVNDCYLLAFRYSVISADMAKGIIDYTEYHRLRNSIANNTLKKIDELFPP